MFTEGRDVDMSKKTRWRIGIVGRLGVGLLTVFILAGCHHKARIIVMLPGTAWESQEIWKQAAQQVEEDRNEPMGSKAAVIVPEELRQYANRHQFLGTQLAESREQGYKIPQDYGELVDLIQQGELVEMPAVGKDYVLFGIGGRADRGPLTRYDPADGSSIPLFSNETELESQTSQLTEGAAQTEVAVSELTGELRALGKRDRRRAAYLRAEISKRQELGSSLNDTRSRIDSWYGDPVRRAGLFTEHQRIAAFASSFEGGFDLADPEARFQFKVRLLAYIRPPARAVLEELAADYDRQFKRPLPVTSMIRTVEYQKELGEVNPNAARNAVPPHTTGLALDVYYHYMTAAEQEFLMREIARMKDAGRIEALRETRDHYHIFAFAEGRPPSGQLIAQSTTELGDSGSAGPRVRIAGSISWKRRLSVLRSSLRRR